MFGPRRDEVLGDWRKMHNVEHNDLYSSPNIIGVISRRMRCTRHVARMGESRSSYRILIGKSEGNRPLGRTSGYGRKLFIWIYRNWEGGHGLD
jgi:hypothetical protein